MLTTQIGGTISGPLDLQEEDNVILVRGLIQMIREAVRNGKEIPHGLIDVQIVMGAMGQGRMGLVVTAVGATI